LGEFFSFIDFEEKANKFLQRCGIENEPSSTEIAELLVKSSYKVWESIEYSVEKYKIILQKLADDYNNINPSLIAEMMEKPILLGVKQNSDSEEEEECINIMNNDNQICENGHCLASAKDIYINDSTIYQEVCHLLTVPDDDDCEFLYEVSY